MPWLALTGHRANGDRMHIWMNTLSWFKLHEFSLCEPPFLMPGRISSCFRLELLMLPHTSYFSLPSNGSFTCHFAIIHVLIIKPSLSKVLVTFYSCDSSRCWPPRCYVLELKTTSQLKTTVGDMLGVHSPSSHSYAETLKLSFLGSASQGHRVCAERQSGLQGEAPLLDLFTNSLQFFHWQSPLWMANLVFSIQMCPFVCLLK